MKLQKNEKNIRKKIFTVDKENANPQLKKNFKLKMNLKRRQKKLNISSKSSENLLLEIEKPSKFPELIGEGVKGKVIKNKSEFGISKNDFEKIELFL